LSRRAGTCGHDRRVEVSVPFKLDVGLAVPIDDFDDRVIGLEVRPVIDAIDGLIESTVRTVVDRRRRSWVLKLSPLPATPTSATPP
jgi:hypothetical protein